MFANEIFNLLSEVVVPAQERCLISKSGVVVRGGGRYSAEEAPRNLSAFSNKKFKMSSRSNAPSGFFML